MIKMKQKDLKYLFVHQDGQIMRIEWHENIVKRYQKIGYNVEPFCAVPDPPGPRYDFYRLDKLWRKKDKKVKKIYNKLLEKTEDCDVLINFNGANIHPQWLRDFNTFNVYICFDDPESSHSLSEPVAKYFDFSFTGNAACIPLYQSWGIDRCDYIPLCNIGNEYDNNLTVEKILEGNRTNDIVFLGERQSIWRKERLKLLKNAFPQAIMRGKGWDDGFLPKEEKIPLYTNTKIGWNIHNSVGPVNLRTFTLPANGILEICDNKSRLGNIFRLDYEIIGFDTIEECINLTQYYLTHDKERREIAARGFERVKRDYSDEKQFEFLINTIWPYVCKKMKGELFTPIYHFNNSNKFIPKISIISTNKKLNSILNPRGYNIEIKKLMPKYDNFNQKNIENGIPYMENEEIGPVNFNEKKKRLEQSNFFEWPNMVALNWAVTKLIGSSKKIVEIGGGTGCFAYEAATDPKIKIICSDLDNEAIEWAKKHRSRPNIEYINHSVKSGEDSFDLVVAIDVIEHISDYPTFLEYCKNLAQKCILSTPNKNRNAESAVASPPKYYQHVREWTPGEFYWVLRTFYRNVKLYSMKNEYIPEIVPIKITDNLSPIIALAENPIYKEHT